MVSGSSPKEEAQSVGLNPLRNDIYDRNLQGVSDLMDLRQGDVLVATLDMFHTAPVYPCKIR